MRGRRPAGGAALVGILCFVAPTAGRASVGDLLTEEAYTLPPGKLRLTTWLDVDEDATQHSTFVVVGLFERLDAAAGALAGAGYGGEKSGVGANGPIAQAKLALVPARTGL